MRPFSPLPPGGSGDAGVVKNQYDSILKGLQDQILATQQLTAYERLLFDIETKRVFIKTAAEKATALDVARGLDLIKERQEIAKAEARGYEQMLKTAQDRQRQIDSETEAVRRLIDPTRVYYQELKRIAELVNSYRVHAQFEEQEFLPLARQIFGRNGNHLAALGMALYMRHVPQPVGYI